MMEYVGEKGNSRWLEHFAFGRVDNFLCYQESCKKEVQGTENVPGFGLYSLSLIIR